MKSQSLLQGLIRSQSELDTHFSALIASDAIKRLSLNLDLEEFRKLKIPQQKALVVNLETIKSLMPKLNPNYDFQVKCAQFQKTIGGSAGFLKADLPAL